MAMPRILFTETRVVQDEHRGTDRQTVYEKGRVYELPLPSCERWKKRGVAVDAPEPKPEPAPAPVVDPEPEPVEAKAEEPAPQPAPRKRKARIDPTD
jgi:hypothetical protein